MATGIETALRRWAQAHAGTVDWKGAAGGTGTAEQRGPLALAASWRTEGGAVWSLACTAGEDGQVLVAVGGDDGRTTVWDALAGGELGTVPANDEPVVSLAWLPAADGRLALGIGTYSCSALVPDADTGVPMVTDMTIREPVQSQAWASTDQGPRLVTGGRDGGVRLWDAETGSPLRALPGHPRAVRSVACGTGPHGPLVASASRGGVTRICDGRTGEQLHDLAGHPHGASALAWVPAAAGRPLLATGSDDGQVLVWDGLNGTVLHRLSCEAGWVVSLAWAAAPDGRLVLAAVTDRGDKLWLWDGATGTPLYTLGDRGHLYQAALAVAPDGRFLLATGGHGGDVHVWWLEHGSVRTPPSPLLAAPPGGQQSAVGEVVFPGWSEGAATERATAVAWAVPPDGPPLLATGTAGGDVQVWDGQTGALRHTLTGLSGVVLSVAWAVLLDGRPLLAAGGDDGRVHAWDGRSGALLGSFEQDLGPINSVAMTAGSQDRVVLAAAGDRGVTCWPAAYQPATHTLEILSGVGWRTEKPPRATAVDIVVHYSTGDVLLVVGGREGDAHVLDAANGRTLRTVRSGPVNSVAWLAPADGPPLLATAGQDGRVLVWNGDDGSLLHTLTEPTGPVHSVAWAQLADGRLLLASAGTFDRRSTRIWDLEKRASVADLPGAQGSGGSLAWALLPNGRAWLTATPGLSPLPRRIWELRGAGGAGDAVPARPVSSAKPGLRPAEAGLLALGRAGLWPPLGLIADLMTLTGPGKAATLNDDGRRALAAHPGIQRLRALGWPIMARICFAGLVASGVKTSGEFVPPAGASAAALRDALTAALPDGARDRLREVDPGHLARAAETITDRTVALLTILGPGTAAADPALPLLLAQHIPKMPALDGRQFQLLQETSGAGSSRHREREGGLRHSPGTAGISKHGSLTRLLPTQLALPSDVLAARYLEDQLLFRRHVGHVPPVPDPVTLILDTTPPTFGPAENILRLAAHLMTSVLWEHGQQPVLISLAKPGSAITLSARPQLVQLWTSRTLDPPGQAIATAVDTARDVGARTVLLCHHFAPQHRYLPGPERRLVTTHQPFEPVPPPPSHPGHFHLPVNPSLEQLVHVVWDLLAPTGRAS